MTDTLIPARDEARAEIERLDLRTRLFIGGEFRDAASGFKNGRLKVEIAIASGKTHEDRRAEIKQRETERDVRRTMQRARRR